MSFFQVFKVVFATETATTPSMKSFQEDLPMPGTGMAPSSTPPIHQEREIANQYQNLSMSPEMNTGKLLKTLWAFHDFPTDGTTVRHCHRWWPQKGRKRPMAHVVEDQLLCIDIELESDEEREIKKMELQSWWKLWWMSTDVKKHQWMGNLLVLHGTWESLKSMFSSFQTNLGQFPGHPRLVFCCPALPVVLSVGRISNTLGIPYAFCAQIAIWECHKS